MMAIRFDVKNLDVVREMMRRMEEQGTKVAIDATHDWLEYTFETAQQVVPTDTGRLASSGDITLTQKGGSIVYTAPYASAVHEGYARHYVRPKRRKVLRWEAGMKERLTMGGSRSNADWAFSRGHYVPRDRLKSTPQPWLANTVDRTLKYLGQFIIDRYKRDILGGGV